MASLIPILVFAALALPARADASLRSESSPLSASALFDSRALKAGGWLAAFKGMADWACAEDAQNLLGEGASWKTLGLINYKEPSRYAVLGPLARKLEELEPLGAKRLRGRMRRMAALSEARKRKVLESLESARSAAAPEVTAAVEGLMNRHVRRQLPLKSLKAAEARIAEVEGLLVPLSLLTLYDPSELSARYNEALLKLDSLRRARRKLLAREQELRGMMRVVRLQGNDLRDAPAALYSANDPYVAARALKAGMRSRGIATVKILVTSDRPSRLLVSLDSPADHEKAQGLFTVEADASLSYHGVPVTLVPTRRQASLGTFAYP